eukprot:TRINITY_DN8960_c0_g1_i1.p1 TRINITY_DN8960_c0_g1~~TRINITY_DN8960_c0_g1_i1.p1  ORF type:complete len:857 (+),score=195.70 TRINITY_DN8960_c0_g1_i1:31-2571(+)
MSLLLRNLIKQVRSASTAAEERNIIARESAAIRSSLKEDGAEYRTRNIAKLLYIQMLGYPAHFGQMHCLELISSQNYSDKRVGYLGLMLLLDENQEVIVLATHALQTDLNHVNQFVAGLALCALGNISSESIAQDLAPDVLKHLSGSNIYLRKKAAICSIRILRKIPSLMEEFIPKIKSLLGQKNHGVLISAVTLVSAMCEIDNANIRYLRRLVPHLVRILRSIVQMGYAQEYDVDGITDPFLQVRILKLLRILGTNDPESVDHMSNVLAQISTNTDSGKNVGNAVLYECVNTIMAIDQDTNSDLRMMGIDILGKFLANRDNNIRYVALNTLCKVVKEDTEAVQLHRHTIVDCLKDPDVSIRRRALDLIYSLVNKSNVRILVRELLNYLVVADVEFKANLVAKLCYVSEKFAPTKRWYIDTILRIIAVSDSTVPKDVISIFINIISNETDLHLYSAQKMYLALTKTVNNQSLVQVSLWCIGEYGELLVNNQDDVNITEDDVLDLFERILKSVLADVTTKKYALNALAKLSVRFDNPQHLQRIRKIIMPYKSDFNEEIQQRACEYDVIGSLDAGTKEIILEKIPPMEIEEEVSGTEESGEYGDNPEAPSGTGLIPGINFSGVPSTGSTGGLIPGIDLSGIPSNASKNTPTPNNGLGGLLPGFNMGGAPPTNNGGLGSLLPGINMGGTSNESRVNNIPSGINNIPPGMNAGNNVPPGMNTGNIGNTGFTVPARPAGIAVFENEHLKIEYILTKPNPMNPAETAITAVHSNKSNFPLNNYGCQAAPARYLKINYKVCSQPNIAPHGDVTQDISVNNTLHGERPIMLKLRVTYTFNGAPQELQPVVQLDQ